MFANWRIESLNAAAMVAVAVLAALYLVAINSVVVANYQKTAIQKNIDALRADVRSLNVNLSEKRSIGFLQQAAKDLNLVANDQVQYVKAASEVSMAGK